MKKFAAVSPEKYTMPCFLQRNIGHGSWFYQKKIKNQK